jgi:hypothetical protein
VALTGRPVADDEERLALVNVVQQLDHLAAHPSVARRRAEGRLELTGLYVHLGEARCYVLDGATRTFTAVPPGAEVPKAHRNGVSGHPGEGIAVHVAGAPEGPVRQQV